MHLTRAKASKRLPIPRKKTKYLARASNHSKEGISVIIAVRDLLGLAKTSKEVKEMVKGKKLKINGKVVKDIKEGIRLFNLLEADKKYKLGILKTGRYFLEEVNDNSTLHKVIGKKVLKGKKTQFNLHDGYNIILNEKINTGDSVELDLAGKLKSIKKFEKGKKVIVISGKSVGLKGKIEDVKNDKTKIKLEEREDLVELEKDHVVVI